MARGRLLFISPILPALGGNGLAMRAGMMLEALAADHDVHLLVIPVAGGPATGPPGPIARWCAGVTILPLPGPPEPQGPDRDAVGAPFPRPLLARLASARAVAMARHAVAGRSFDEVHVFRLYMAPFADSYLETIPPRRPICALDLDDHESRTRERLAALHARARDERSAAFELREALRYRAMEAHYLPRFDRVYVCSAADRAALARAHGCRSVAVVPNGVRIPAVPPPAARSRTSFTFLFVASLAYSPNADAARFFCVEVLPGIRAATRRAVRVLLVGSQPGPEVRRLAARPGVVVTGTVADVTPYYGRADAVIVPVRAGGGSRIKLLEAFAHGRPVVSTGVGAEGIEARHGQELLIADGPAAFAAACVRLMKTPALGRALAGRALALVRRRHGPAAILGRVRAARRLRRPGSAPPRSDPRRGRKGSPPP
jgi:glycosyltransferase involved in cell wall biosynthesis